MVIHVIDIAKGCAYAHVPPNLGARSKLGANGRCHDTSFVRRCGQSRCGALAHVLYSCPPTHQPQVRLAANNHVAAHCRFVNVLP